MFWNRKEKIEIVFSNVLDYHENTAPQPAVKHIPQWYKETKGFLPDGKMSAKNDITIKKCMPVLDALTAGYILPTPHDIWVEKKDGKIIYYTGPAARVETHQQHQSYLHPKANGHETPKYINGWSIKTPEGYSSLFIPPMHNSHPWFECFPGVVDTDNYFHTVHFPFVLKDTNFEGLIPAGTPMIQVIPFKRDNWSSRIGTEIDKINARENEKLLFQKFFNRYKSLFWKRKTWG
jgi:hypothetical protein